MEGPQGRPVANHNENTPRYRRGAEWIAIIDFCVNLLSLISLVSVSISLAMDFLLDPSFKHEPKVKAILNDHNLTLNTLMAITAAILVVSIIINLATLYMATDLLSAADPATPNEEALEKANRWLWVYFFLLVLHILSTNAIITEIVEKRTSELGVSILKLMFGELGKSAMLALIIFRLVGLLIVYLYECELDRIVEAAEQHGGPHRGGAPAPAVARLVSAGDVREPRRSMVRFYQRN